MIIPFSAEDIRGLEDLSEAVTDVLLRDLTGKYKTRELSSAEFWVKLDELVAQRKLSREGHMQVFWDAHEKHGKSWLVEQCPHFKPQQGVWATGDAKAIRRAVLLLRSGLYPPYINAKVSKEKSLRTKQTLIVGVATTFLTGLVLWVLGSLNTAVLVLLSLSSGLLLWRKKTSEIRTLEAKRREIVRSAKLNSGPQQLNSGQFPETFADISLFSALLRKFKRGECTSADVWRRINELTQNGSLYESLKFVAFWCSHSDAGQQWLVQQSPLFDPDHTFWIDSDDFSYTQAQSLLDDLMKNKGKLWCSPGNVPLYLIASLPALALRAHWPVVYMLLIAAFSAAVDTRRLSRVQQLRKKLLNLQKAPPGL